MQKLEEIESAAYRGDPAAQYRLGLAFLRGTEAPRDIQRSFRWCKSSSDQGYAPAQFTIGWFYYTGMVVRRDYGKAEQYYQEAAKQGYPEAQLNLGLLLCEAGGEHNRTRAMPWLQKAAAQGVTKAQATLGLHYMSGCGIPRDPVLGYAWLSMAADNGLSSWKHLLILSLARLWISSQQRRESQAWVDQWNSDVSFHGSNRANLNRESPGQAED